ncbi:MAG TPA: DNA polymerase III [Azospirillum sp.]
MLNRKGTTVDPAYAFLLDERQSGEQVAIHCEATSFDPAKADLRAVAAVRIRGPRILASQRFVAAFWPTEPPEPAIDALLRFIGNRPLVGYYLDFTLTLLDRLVEPVAGIPLPNERVEVSSLYYDRKRRRAGKSVVDLRLDAIVGALGLPPRVGDDATANALASAMVYLRLKPPVR